MIERKPRVLRDLTKLPKRETSLDLAFREIEETYLKKGGFRRKFGETIEELEERRRYRQWEIRRGY